LALDFYEVSFAEFCQTPIQVKREASGKGSCFTGGYIGVLSYDEYDMAPHRQMPKPSRVFRVDRALVFYQDQKRLFLVSSKRLVSEGGDFSALRSGVDDARGFTLVPRSPDSDYLSACERAIADIRAGRFYQINLLRYFSVKERYTRKRIVAQFKRFAGPYSSWFDVPGLAVASLSPERFFSFKPDKSGNVIAKTYPVKGTRPRFADHARDAASRQELQESRKDQAELHMIVDLMRNDLNTVSKRGSVVVERPGEVESYPSVHHLVARVRSELDPSLTIGEVLRRMCPAGSISGCPKREVMLGIAEAEQRRRGYFMGNSFYLSDSGYFDSSVLIRTLVAEPDCSGQWEMEYAAGSGIVIGSEAAKEMQEIYDKCKVVKKG
jgi:anthranilate/para-aminobenzoate synthase component I